VVVAVASKGKSGVGQGENKTPMAGLVAIEVLVFHHHAHAGAPRGATEQIHAHSFAGGAVVGKHHLPDLLGQRCLVHGFNSR
jgi:hypothetical protein